MEYIEVILPKHDNLGNNLEQINNDQIINICGLFGGATVFDANGFWINDNGVLFNEPVSVVRIATNDANAKEKSLSLH